MTAPFHPGQIVDNKYRIERVLGVGGMGVVVAATHLALDQLVAIKLMLGGAAQSPADVGRFVREARAASRLRSQHVGRVFDVATLEDGTPYIVMEHLSGKDLLQTLREHGPLPVSAAADYLAQACEAIAEAHAQGIVHRDIKPANLFLTRGLDDAPCVKVLDFGISRWMSGSTEQLEPSQPMGSAPYMAPEQLAAPDRIDARTDVWALGATLFHLLTGKTPFHRPGVDTVHAMLHAVLHAPPLPPLELRPNLPPALAAVLLRCLEKDPANRYAHAAALSAALLPFGTEQAAASVRRAAAVLGVSMEPARAVTAPERHDLGAGATMPFRPSPEAARSSRASRQTRRTRLVVGAGLVAALGLLGWAWIRKEGAASAGHSGSASAAKPEAPSAIATEEAVVPAAIVTVAPSGADAPPAASTSNGAKPGGRGGARVPAPTGGSSGKSTSAPPSSSVNLYEGRR
jgi:serine/threonine-protein kinase